VCKRGGCLGWIGIENRGNSVFISIQLEGAVRQINKIMGLGVQSNRLCSGGGPAGGNMGTGRARVAAQRPTIKHIHITVGKNNRSDIVAYARIPN
jgi:hypothetical protein